MIGLRTLAAVGLLVGLSLAGVRGADETIVIETPWVRAVPEAMSATAAYFVIKNTGAEDVSLVGGSTDIAGMVAPMISTKREEGGQTVMGMETVPEVKIAAGESVTLKPGGDHLMLMKLSEHPKLGETVEITLEFEPGGRKVNIPATVLMAAPKP